MGHRAPSRPGRLRRLVAGGTGLVLATSPLLWAAPAGASTPSLPTQPAGLFGAADPTYDGVFRQSLSLLAYQAARMAPPPAAVAWLLGQQCADGGFPSYRANTTRPCAPYNATTFSGGEDTNATGLAIAALKSVGQGAAQARATSWLVNKQNKDGGWEFTPGSGTGSDANSTAIVVTGLASTGGQAATVARGQKFLQTLQIGCAGVRTDTDGALAYQDFGNGLVRNDKATAQAVLALAGTGLPVTPGTLSTTVPRLTCPTGQVASPEPAQVGAGYLMRELDAFGGAIPNADFTTGEPKKGTVNPGDTAWAALSLVAVGYGRDQVTAALQVLDRAVGAATPKLAGARTSSTAATDDPGLLALVALAGHAGGRPGSTTRALVARIGATERGAVPTSTTTPTPGPTPSSSASTATGTLPDTGGSSLPVVIGLAGLVLLASGIGLRLTGRGSRHA